MSIRTRLTIGIVLLLAVTFAVLGGAIVGISRATLTAQVDARVLTSASRGIPYGYPKPPKDGDSGYGRDGDRDATGNGSRGNDYGDDHDGDRGKDPPIATPVVAEGTDAEPEDPFERPVAWLVYAPDGSLASAYPSGYPDAPDPLPLLPDPADPAFERLVGRVSTVPAVDGPLRFRVLVRPTEEGGFIADAASLASVDAAIARLVRAVTVAAALACLIAALAAWWMIRQGLRPIDRMIDTAAAIAAGDLGRRVPDADPRTELGRLGAALNEMLARIEQAVRAREASEDRLRRFVADAAHELRTPLTSLRGWAELFRQGALAEPAALSRAMGRIESEGARMARLVDELLLLARLDQHRGLVPEPEPVDLALLARDAAADFAAADPNHPLALDLPPAGTALAAGDRARLRQVLDNLLANARAHTPAGTPVRLTVRATPPWVELTVADSGPGIPRDAQPHVFERFWRADPGRHRATGGSGLGLSIVASIVEAHGGAVALASDPGNGAAFTVRLPAA